MLGLGQDLVEGVLRN